MLRDGVEVCSKVGIGNSLSLGGLDLTGVIIITIVSVILIVTVVWLFHGTKKRD